MTVTFDRNTVKTALDTDYTAIAAKVAQTLVQTVQAREAQPGVPTDEI
ncbi:MAG TPA: hypothetical protein V6D20_12960 [Candidatus Obscuribacterales bacterium]|nr:hypothetical protein [Leptolyngbya sp. CCY15150]